jgi:hypothetical protein
MTQGLKGCTDHTMDMGDELLAWYDGYMAIHEVVEVHVDSTMPMMWTRRRKSETL